MTDLMNSQDMRGRPKLLLTVTHKTETETFANILENDL
jgi:hypothetical protein